LCEGGPTYEATAGKASSPRALGLSAQIRRRSKATWPGSHRALCEGGPTYEATAGKASSSVYYVYLLRSEPDPRQYYVGSTSDLKNRFAEHNRGDSIHTAKFRPWKLRVYFAFHEKKQAIAFERYLKTGSGRAFAMRHFR